MNCLVLIFSKDRALQLDGTLRSLLFHCSDIAKTQVRVLFTGTSTLHFDQYSQLEQDYQLYPFIQFIREENFYGDVIALLAPFDHVLFLVDDNIFVRAFSLYEQIDILEKNKDALGFSLRLGKNTTYCYPVDKDQQLPAFQSLGHGTLKYTWTAAEYDFGYPLEVSSSLYRVQDILPFIANFSFKNPNTLEANMAGNSAVFRDSKPFLLCREKAVTFCIPLNKVQNVYTANRAVDTQEYSSENLAQLFARGQRIDIASFINFIPNACHQEAAIQFVQAGAEPETKEPLVSVIIPCYNQAQYLPEAVESIVNQTYTNWECIIVNDGSPDNTSEVARQLIARYPDRKIILLEKENGGLADARNYGIKNSKGEYILPLDSDDKIHPEMLEKTVSILQAQPNIHIVYTDTVRFGKVHNVYQTGEFSIQALCTHNPINYCSLYRREVWESVGGYKTNMVYGYEDWDFWISCAEKGFAGVRIPEYLFLYRIKDDSMLMKAYEHDAELKAKIVLNHPKLYDPKTVEWAESLRKKVFAPQLPKISASGKILFVVHNFPTVNLAGTELYTLTLAQKLRKRGYSVRILYPDRARTSPEGTITEDNYEGLPITKININPDHDIIKEFKNEKVASSLSSYLENIDVDLVHFQHLSGLSASALQVFAGRNCPVIMTVHDAWLICEQIHLVRADGSFCEGGPETVDKCAACFAVRNRMGSSSENLPEIFYALALRRQFLQNALTWIDALIVPSRFIYETFKTHGFLHRNTQTIPLGINPFAPLPHVADEKHIRFTFLGNIYNTKGLDIAIRAFDLLDSQKAELNIYGRIADKKYFNHIMAGIRPGTNIKYHGLYTPNDLPTILANTDVTVLPSRAENYPFVARESLHAGVPVIASNVGGIPEIIEDGVNGFLFRQGDYQALADKMRFFVDHPDEVAAFRRRIKPVRTIDEDVVQLEELYNGLIANKSIDKPAAAINASAPADEEKLPKVSIIIPTFNNLNLTQQCLKAIHDTAGNAAHEIIVVDNNSSDGTADYLRNEQSAGRIRVILNDENLGFAKACNQGIKASGGKYVLLLNNDTIPQPGWLEALVAEIESDSRICIVGACLLYPDSRIIQHAGVVIGSDNDGLLPYHKYRLRKLDSVAEARRSRDCKAVTAACMLVRREVFDRVAMLDEEYVNGFEDVDFCFRTYKSGGRIRYCAQSTLSHYESMTQKRHDYDARNLQRLRLKWNNLIEPDEDVEQSRLGFYDMCIREEIQKNPDSIQHLQLLHAYALQRGDYEEADEWQQRIDQLRGITQTVRPDISIVIPVFNRVEYTRVCHYSLKQNTAPFLYEVIIVDNASTDETKEFLKSIATDIKIITNERNLGFARACNQGAEIAQGKYLVFLNNDTEAQKGWVEHVIKDFEDDDTIGIIGSKLIYPDGTVQHAGIEFINTPNKKFPFWPSHRFRHSDKDDMRVNRFEEVHAVTGACLFIPKDLFEAVGGFTEEYPMYFEDIDLNLKVRGKGRKIFYEPKSVVVHHEGRSSPDQTEIDRLNIRSAELFFPKWDSVINEMVGSQKKPAGIEILWHAPIFDPSGYADEARNFLLHLDRKGFDIAVRSIGRVSEKFLSRLDPSNRLKLEGMLSKQPGADFISLLHFPAYAFQRIPEAKYNIGRTMFETDSLPHDWVIKCNQMDEVWVPSEFNMETFRRAGVKTGLFKVPGGIDTELFRPGIEPLKIPGVRSTVFLSVFEWIYRKGWDVLLRAWASAFGPEDDVCLVLRTYPVNVTDAKSSSAEIDRIIDIFLRQEMGIARDRVAPIILLREQVPEQDMPRLFAAANAYVAPSRGEGWGRPQMAAMACGLPVIATRWSGNLEFMDDQNSLLIDIEGLVEIDERVEIPFYRGQRWAEPSAEHLAVLMKKILSSPAEAVDIGNRARRDMVEKWSWDTVSGIAADRLCRVQERLSETQSYAAKSVRTERTKPIAAVWEGSQFVTHSLALVNREICIRLAQDAGIDLSILPYEPDQFSSAADPRFIHIEKNLNRPLGRPADVHVRHQWPPDFIPPGEGRWVLMQPWEFGSIPKEWVENIHKHIDEVWAYSSYVRDCYVRSGVPAGKVHVIPLGVDSSVFNPDAPPLHIRSKKKFKFLFVGGTIGRKGIDILIDVYKRAFTADDDVCLVIKDMGGQSFYKGQTAQQMIAGIQKIPGAPEISYIDRTLNTIEMPGLYTACDALVHPYRGEGFGLPIAEAMACGLPVIVTGHGAALDFCSDKTAYLIPAREVRLPEKKIGNTETVDFPWLAEPDREALGRVMKYVAAHPEEAKAKGSLATAFIQKNFSWERTAERVMDRLEEINGKPILRFAEKTEEIAHETHYEEGLTSIILLISDNREYPRKCVESIRKNTKEPFEIIFAPLKASYSPPKWMRRLMKESRNYRVVHFPAGSTNTRTLRQAQGDRLKKQPPAPPLLRGDLSATSPAKNILNYAQACNVGIAEAKGEYIAILRDDTLVTTEWLAGMLECLRREKYAGVVGPMTDNCEGRQRVESGEESETHRDSLRLIENEGKDDTNGDRKRTGSTPPLRGGDKGEGETLSEDHPHPNPPPSMGREVTSSPASSSLIQSHLETYAKAFRERNRNRRVPAKTLDSFCILFKNDLIEKLGLFDEGFESGTYAVKDYCLRAGLEGLRNLIAGDVFVHCHDHPSLSEREDEISFGEKWGSHDPKPESKAFSDPALFSLAGNEKSVVPPISDLTSIVIQVHNRWDQTERCLKSIEEHTPEPHEIIVVDNGSADETRERLRELLKTTPDLRVIVNNKNRGYAAGMNQGISIARGEYILLLSNDAVVTPGWLGRMKKLFNLYPKTGIAGPMSNDVTPPQLADKVDYADTADIGDFAVRWSEEHEGQSFPATKASGFCLLTGKKVIDSIGGLDEQFSTGNFEDDDFCNRAFLTGFEIRIAQDVFIHCEARQSERETGSDYNAKIARDRELYKTKWEVPKETPIDRSWIPSRIPDSTSHFFPLPELLYDHTEDKGRRWWKDLSDEQKEKEKENDKEKTGRIKDLTSIILIISDQREYPRKCVESIRKHTKEPHEIIFIAPEGVYDTPKWLRKMLKENRNYRLETSGKGSGLQQKKRSGDPLRSPVKQSYIRYAEPWIPPQKSSAGKRSYAQSCNLGISKSSGEYIAIIRDNTVVTEDWLAGMIECLNSEPDAGIVGPMTDNGEGLQRLRVSEWQVVSGEETDIHRESLSLIETEGKDDTYAKAFRERNRYRRVPAKTLDSICIFFKHGLTGHIGLFDEEFSSEIHAVDDYCLRAAAEGLKNLIAGDVLIHSYGQLKMPPVKDRIALSKKWGDINQPKQESGKAYCANILFLSNELSQKGLKEKATVTLVEGIKSFPGEKKLHYALAEMLIGDSKYRDALDVLERMPAGFMEDREKLELMGYCMEGLGLPEEAEKYADKVIGLDSNFPKAWNLKGAIAFRKNLPADAEKFFTRAIEADRGFGEAYSNLGALKWIAGDKDGALKLFERAFILSPAIGDVVTNYYTAAVAMSRLPEAETVFREAIALYPQNRKLQFILIDNLLQQHKFSEAMHEMEEALMTFGIDDDTLTVALKLRDTIGPMEIGRAETYGDSSGFMDNNSPFEKGDKGGCSSSNKKDTSEPDIDASEKEIISKQPPAPPLLRGNKTADSSASHGVPVEKYSTPPLTGGDKGEGEKSAEDHPHPKPPPSMGREVSSPPNRKESQSVPISLCMIVKNEEKNIAAALRSAKPVVNEMIVVDTGSTDKTKKIAKVFGAKVYDFPWTNDFSEARNFSLSKASGDWILVLDADEVISPLDYGKLRELVETTTAAPLSSFDRLRMTNSTQNLSNNSPLEKGDKGEGEKSSEDHPHPNPPPSMEREVSSSNISTNLNKSQQVSSLKTAFSLTTRNYVGPVSVNWHPNDGQYREEAGSGWFPSVKVRLFPNNNLIRFERNVHEIVEDSIRRMGLQIMPCDIPIHHYGKLNREDIRAKGEEYYQLGKRKLAVEGELNANALYELAMQASELEKFDEAVEYWKKLIILKPDMEKAHNGLGTCYFRLGRYEDARAAFAKAVQTGPGAKDQLVMYATSELLNGNAGAAILHLEGLLKKEPSYPLALLGLTAAYFCAGNKEKGLEYADKVGNTQFGLAIYMTDIAKLLISVEKSDYAIALLEAAVDTGNVTDETEELLESLKKKSVIDTTRDLWKIIPP